MAVNTQTYTVSTLPYTATDFAAAIRSAFIHAGWMTDWHAAFTSGSVVNRVMRYNHGTTETYCNTHYWFQFSSADMFFYISRGWNTSTNIPQGVSGVGAQYLDYLSTTTSATTNHMRFALFNANQAITIMACKSDINPKFSFILIKQGTVEFNLVLDRSDLVATSVDLNKVCYMGLMFARARTSGGVGGVNLQYYSPKLKGSHLGGWLRDNVTALQYGASNTASLPWEISSGDSALNPQTLYGYYGNESNSTANILNMGALSLGGMYLVGVGFTNTNPDFTSDYSPPFTGMTVSSYSTGVVPADFAIFASYTNNTLSTFDPITIVAGSMVFQVLLVANASILNTRPTVLIAARIV